jgi:hypothetical protein
MAISERFRSVRGRNPKANPLIIIGFVWVMFGITFESFRSWLYIGIPLLVAGIIRNSMKNRNQADRN